MISWGVKIDEDFGVAEGATTAVARHDAGFTGDRGNFSDEVNSVPGEEEEVNEKERWR